METFLSENEQFDFAIPFRLEEPSCATDLTEEEVACIALTLALMTPEDSRVSLTNPSFRECP